MLVWQICKNELKMFIKDRVALIMLFTLPLLFIWLFMQAFSPYLYDSRYSELFSIAIVDEDNTTLSQMLVNQFQGEEYIEKYVQVHHTDRSTAMDMLEKDEIAGIIIMPEDFTGSIYRGENRSLIYIGNQAQAFTSDLLKGQLESSCQLVSAGQSGVLAVLRSIALGGANADLRDSQLQETVYAFTMDALDRTRIFAEKTVSFIPNVNPSEYFSASLIIVFVAFLSIRGMKSLLDEKEPGMGNRLKSSPLRLWQLIGGKLLASFLVAFVQLIVIVSITGLVFQNYFGGSMLNLCLLFLAAAFAVAAWAMFVAGVSPNPQVASLLGYVGTPVLAIIGGNIYPLVAMPDILKTASQFTLNRWAMDGFLKVFAGDTSFTVGQDVSMLIIIGAVFLVLGTVSFGLAWKR